MENKIIIYTDGACKGNPGPGGWGVVIIENSNQTELSGKDEDTTNNIMELTAVIEALLIIKKKSDITIITDSNGNALKWRVGGIEKSEFIELLSKSNLTYSSQRK